jgi:hypothetical protein
MGAPFVRLSAHQIASLVEFITVIYNANGPSKANRRADFVAGRAHSFGSLFTVLDIWTGLGLDGEEGR